MACGNCRYFSPSPVHELLGFCHRRSAPVSWALEECREIERLSLGEIEESLARGIFAYCLSCRTTLASVGEVEEHLAEGHIVSPRILEEDILEEVYAGD